MAKPRIDWSWLGILKIIPVTLALTTGSLTVLRDLVFLTGQAPEPHAAFWTWLRICFLVSGAYEWFQQHKIVRKLEERLTPKIELLALRSRTWQVESDASGIEYWIDIFNPSYSVSLEHVMVEMTEISPDLFTYLPLPLHVKHDQSYKVREFSINPRGTGMVDILTGPSGPAGTQQVIIVPHTIGGGWTGMPLQEYTFKLTTTAHNTPPAEAKFRAWVGEEDGKLKCVQL